MKYKCKICDWTGELPENAIKLSPSSRNSCVLYKFPDGSVHDLKRDNTEKIHNRWHNYTNKNGDVVTHKNPSCRYCYPELFEEPFMGDGVTQARQVADNLEAAEPAPVIEPVPAEPVPAEPDPVEVFLDEEPIGVPVPEIKPAPAPEPKLNTTMARAFKNLRRV